MELRDFFLAQLEREANLCRKAVAAAPRERHDWRPHERSMPFGYLATLVATMPGWIAMAIQQDALDLAPPGGGTAAPPSWDDAAELLSHLEREVAKSRAALEDTSDAHLATPWRLLVGGRVVLEQPRREVIADSIAHLAHHRGQYTVYLRLLDLPVPALYGPSADEGGFAAAEES